jgi:AcrR family transcriptional regulator
MKGYPAVTVEDVTRRAGVSRRTFYDMFADKEDCFLRAYELIVDRLLAAVADSYASVEGDWPRQLGAALRAVTELFRSEPELARLVVVEALAAGHRALRQRDALLKRFVVFFEGGRAALPAAIQGEELLLQAVVGGLYEAFYGYIVEGQADRLPDLLPDLLYCALVPFVGHGAATEASESERSRPTGP